jgi:ribonuclease HI
VLNKQLFLHFIDKSGAWGYFNGATHNDPSIEGAGRTVYLNDTHFISFKAGIGPASNNYTEVMAPKLSIILAAEYGVNNPQLFGDPMLVIKWVKIEYILRNCTLQPLFDEIMQILAGFNRSPLSASRWIVEGWSSSSSRGMDHYREEKWPYF